MMLSFSLKMFSLLLAVKKFCYSVLPVITTLDLFVSLVYSIYFLHRSYLKLAISNVGKKKKKIHLFNYSKRQTNIFNSHAPCFFLAPLPHTSSGKF